MNGSAWWKAICRLGKFNNMEDWFKSGLKRKLGRGNKVRFWEDEWFGPISMKELFPRLYSVSEDKNKVIESIGEWVGERWQWNFDGEDLFCLGTRDVGGIHGYNTPCKFKERARGHLGMVFGRVENIFI